MRRWRLAPHGDGAGWRHSYFYSLWDGRGLLWPGSRPSPQRGGRVRHATEPSTPLRDRPFWTCCHLGTGLPAGLDGLASQSRQRCLGGRCPLVLLAARNSLSSPRQRLIAVDPGVALDWGVPAYALYPASNAPAIDLVLSSSRRRLRVSLSPRLRLIPLRERPSRWAISWVASGKSASASS